MTSNDVPLREYLDDRFDRLESRLEKIEGLQARVAVLEEQVSSHRAQAKALWGFIATLVGTAVTLIVKYIA